VRACVCVSTPPPKCFQMVPPPVLSCQRWIQIVHLLFVKISLSLSFSIEIYFFTRDIFVGLSTRPPLSFECVLECLFEPSTSACLRNSLVACLDVFERSFKGNPCSCDDVDKQMLPLEERCLPLNVLFQMNKENKTST